MIALNKILENREEFEKKFKLMGKKINLERIVLLEKSFINIDKKASELRAKCNKLCGEIFELINNNLDTKEALSNINKLDKEIIKLSKKSCSSMNKINKIIKKLPNPAIDKNILNISIKTKNNNEVKTINDFINKISEFANIEQTLFSEKKFYSSLKKVVFKSENFPKIIKLGSSKSQKVLMMSDNQTINEIYSIIEQILTQNSKFLVLKSIRNLKKYSSKELVSMLYDGTRLSVELLGEYVSRENSVKFYDKTLDMTQFVNMIKITVL